MIKQKDKPLIIYNTLTQTLSTVKDFDAPEAFIFLYDKEKFLTLKEGKIEIWTVNKLYLQTADGERITDFGGQVLSSKVDSHTVPTQNENQDYIVSVSQSKRYLFSYLRQDSTAFVNVIDIQTDLVIAQIPIGKKKVVPVRARQGEQFRRLSSLYYDEGCHELYIGYADGDVECWSATAL